MKILISKPYSENLKNNKGAWHLRQLQLMVRFFVIILRATNELFLFYFLRKVIDSVIPN